MILDPGGAPVDTNGKRIYPDLPLATYFANAGLSEADAVDLDHYVRRELVERLKRKAGADGPAERLLYMNDPEYRVRIHREMIADILLHVGFTSEELRVIDKALNLNLHPEDEKTVATVEGAAGEDTFSVVEETRGPGGKRYVLKNERTGEHEVVE
ncbi:MAG: hypothetical protein ACYTFI_21155 [Planctomycetota bacterium]|jgi:hypothetical protein